uniref:P-type domain-containing protein n=1 Tax=Amazona collaria TaxID=241587 RepID=A0A8B9FRI0_9PSIT
DIARISWLWMTVQQTKNVYSIVQLFASRCQCKMEAKERRNCGYPGITAEQCRKAGCCFNSSVPGVPWCFSPKDKSCSPVLQGIGVYFT